MRLASEYQANRIDANGASVKDDPYTMFEFGEYVADLRAARAANEIYARCGGNALRMDQPMQRCWRDSQACIHHAIHAANTVYHAAILSSLGAEPKRSLRKMI